MSYDQASNMIGYASGGTRASYVHKAHTMAILFFMWSNQERA